MTLLAMALWLGAQFVADASAQAPASQPALWDTQPDTWSATDGLGRTLLDHEQAGPPRRGKFVGMFYFLWLGQHGTDGPYDISKILAQEPGALLVPSSPLWGPQHHYHHWGEPLFGYYFSDDTWVIAKHAQMLADAGVDTLIFDVTNQITYQQIYMRLCGVFTDLRRQGRRTPQIAFLCPFGDPRKVVSELYEHLYKPGLYRELWFQWKGRPLILADPARVAPETQDFFTFRKPQPDYFQGPTGPDQWGWLEIHPQHAFYDCEKQPEQVTVGVAQNGSGRRLCAFSEQNTYGRSWHDGRQDPQPDAVLKGLNFAEQWERALKIDPEFIFITGWNEWIAMRLNEFNGVREPVMFVDQFDQEHSRDIEPMRGGHGDNYYYQMANYIRRFKGVRPPLQAGAPKAIQIDGDFADWRDVQPEYRDDRGDTMNRDHPGYDHVGRYTDATGRNDFELLKVTYDADSVYFYARTKTPITSARNPNWMMLFIDADVNPDTGWEGFDLVVNRTIKGPGTSLLERSTKGWEWRTQAEVLYRVAGRELELAVPREALAATGARARLIFNFKWADNMQTPGEVMDFITHGDAAPNGRFTYRFR